MKETTSVLQAVREFIRLESAGGILLLASAVIAMLAANSPLSAHYSGLLDTTVAVQVGSLAIQKPLLLWINDGLMAVFFFLIGLEIIREVIEGELSSLTSCCSSACRALRTLEPASTGAEYWETRRLRRYTGN